VCVVLQLPSNYNFEIPKTVWKIKSCSAKLGIIDQHLRHLVCCDSWYRWYFRMWLDWSCRYYWATAK